MEKKKVYEFTLTKECGTFKVKIMLNATDQLTFHAEEYPTTSTRKERIEFLEEAEVAVLSAIDKEYLESVGY